MGLKDYIQLLFGIRNDIKNVIKEKFSVEQGKAETVTDDFTTYANFIAEMNYTAKIIKLRFITSSSTQTTSPASIVAGNPSGGTSSLQLVLEEDAHNLMANPVVVANNVYFSGSPNVNALRVGSAANAGTISLKLNPNIFPNDEQFSPKKVEIICWGYNSSSEKNYWLRMFGKSVEITVVASDNSIEPETPQTIILTDLPDEPLDEITLTVNGADGGNKNHRTFIKSITIWY